MAISGGDLTTLRASGAHYVKPHLYVTPLVTIGTMLINQTTFNYPTNALTVDTISLNGGLANLDAVPLNSMVYIGTSSGAHDVMASALSRRSAAASNIFLSGFGHGDPGIATLSATALANNQYVTIYATKPLWGFLSRIFGGLFYKKYNVSYTDEGSDPAPVCNIGPWVRLSLTGASVSHTFTNAAVTDVKPASFAWGAKTISSYAWSFRNASYALNTGGSFTGSSTSAAATIEFTTAGFYIVSCTITDSSSKTHTADTYVWVDDGTVGLSGWRVTQDVQTRQGRRMTVEMLGSVAESSVYPGAGFLYYETQTFNAGSTVTDGATVTTFVGFVDEERGIRDVGYGRVEFDIISPALLLDKVPMAPQYIQEVSSPASWVEISSALSSPNGVAWYVLQHHCPASLQVFDFDPLPDASDYRDQTYTLSRESVFGQLQEIAALQMNVGSRSSGALVMRLLPWLMDSADRTALDSRMTWTTADLRADPPLEYPETIRLGSGQIDAYGFSYDGTIWTPYISRAPGDAQAQGNAKENVQPFYLPSSGAQDRLNELAGHYLQARNKPPSPVLRVQRNLDTADPALMVWHKLTLTASEDPRGRGFTARRFVPEQVVRQWEQVDSGAWLKRIEITIQPETAGLSGQTKPVPVDTDSAWDPGLGGSWLDFGDFPTFDPADEAPADPSRIIVAHWVDAAVAIGTSTDNFVSDVSYTDISTGIVGSPRWMQADYFSPRRYFLATTDGLYRCEDVTATTPIWYKVHGVENILAAHQSYGFHFVTMTPHRQGWIAVCNFNDHVEVSLDYGETWTAQRVTADNTVDRQRWCQLQVSPYASEDYPYVWFRADDAIYLSTDWGLTWASAFALPASEFGKGTLNLPLFKAPGVPNDPTTAQTMYIVRAYNGNVVSPSRPIQRTDDGGVSFATAILGTAAGAGNYAGWPSPSMRSLQTYTQDGQIVAALERTNGTPIALRGVLSNDSGVTTVIMPNPPTVLTNLDAANLNGWPSDPLRYIAFGYRDVSGVDAGFLASTLDGGASAWLNLITAELAPSAIFTDGQIAYAEFMSV